MPRAVSLGKLIADSATKLYMVADVCEFPIDFKIMGEKAHDGDDDILMFIDYML